MHRPPRIFRLLRPLAAPCLAALCLAALPCAAAQAADVNPDGSVAPARDPDAAAKVSSPQVLEGLKKAAQAQGDISPLTVKAMQHDPKAMEAISQETRAPSGSGGGGKKNTKAMYGDIIIHK